MEFFCRSQWPRGLRRRSAATRLLRSWVRIPPGAWMFVCCECCVWSGRGLCDELITRPEESYRLWCVVVCDLENLKNEEAMTRVGSQRHSKTKKNRKNGILLYKVISVAKEQINRSVLQILCLSGFKISRVYFTHNQICISQSRTYFVMTVILIHVNINP